MRSDSEDFSDQDDEPFVCPPVLFGVANPLFDGASSSSMQQRSLATQQPPSMESGPPREPCNLDQHSIGLSSEDPSTVPQPMPSPEADVTDAIALHLDHAAITQLIQQVEEEIEAQGMILDRNVLTFKLQAWKQQLARYPYWAAQEASMREVLHHAGLIVSKQFVAEVCHCLLRQTKHALMNSIWNIVSRTHARRFSYRSPYASSIYSSADCCLPTMQVLSCKHEPCSRLQLHPLAILLIGHALFRAFQRTEAHPHGVLCPLCPAGVRAASLPGAPNTG